MLAHAMKPSETGCCGWCGTLLQKKSNKGKEKKFCSPYCGRNYRLKSGLNSRPCEWCGKEIIQRGKWKRFCCARHRIEYKEFDENPTRLESVTCLRCDKTFETISGFGSTDQRRMFCSKRCNLSGSPDRLRRYAKKRRKERRVARAVVIKERVTIQRKCEWCTATFTTHTDMKFCCGDHSMRMSQYYRNPTRLASFQCAWCLKLVEYLIGFGGLSADRRRRFCNKTCLTRHYSPESIPQTRISFCKCGTITPRPKGNTRGDGSRCHRCAKIFSSNWARLRKKFGHPSKMSPDMKAAADLVVSSLTARRRAKDELGFLKRRMPK